MKKNPWVPSTEPFENALKDVQSAYQLKSHQELDTALEGHETLLARLKNAEKSTRIANSKLTRNTEQADLTESKSEVTKLDNAFQVVEASIATCVDTVVDIEKCLPEEERLISVKGTSGKHYSNIHQYLESRRN